MMPDSDNADQEITAEQGSAGADERARAVASAGEAQGIYVALLNAANQGFCTIEMKFDDDNRPVDYLFLEVNPSFERQTGIENAVGRWMRDISPDQDRYWYDLYGRVALTGNPERLENFSTALDRWFSVYALKIEGAGRVAVLFDDITDRKRAEAALRASEEQFETLLNQAPLGVYLVDSDLVIRQVNPVALPVFGDIPGGPVGRCFDDVMHVLWDKEYADELVGIIRHTLDTGEPYITPERAENRADRDITEYYEWRLDRIALSGGRFGVVCYFRDISEQVHTRLEIERARTSARVDQERHAFLLALSDALRAEPSAEAVADRALGMLFVQMGLNRCYIANYRVAEDKADIPHQIHDDSLPPLPAEVRLSDFPEGLRIVSDRTLVIDNVAAHEGLSDNDRASTEGLGLRALVIVTLRKGASNPLWAIVAGSTQPRAWTQSEVSLVEEVAERTWAAVERARSEAARVKADQSFTRLFEASPAPFLVLAPDPPQFTITEVNDAYLAATMRTREELVGRALFDAFPDNPNEPTSTGVSDLRASLERVLATRRPDALPGLNYDIARPDGSFEERWWSPVNSPILNEKGEVEAIIHNANDVTEDRRAEAALRDSERHQGLLLAELQHRVRNILTMIRSVARRTAENCVDVDDYVRHLDGRLSSLARVQTILTRRPTRGANLYDLVLDELQMQTASPAQYQIEGPEVELLPKAAEVLSLAIHELATNSIKYGVLAEPSGVLSIRWSVDDRDGQDWLRFKWNEPVSPRPDRPSRTGFGTDLIKNRVPYELRGVGDIVIGNDEVVAQIDFPLINSQTGLHGGTQDKDLAQ